MWQAFSAIAANNLLKVELVGGREVSQDVAPGPLWKDYQTKYALPPTHPQTCVQTLL